MNRIILIVIIAYIIISVYYPAHAATQVEYALVPQQMQPAKPARNVDLGSFRFPCEGLSACLIPFYADEIDYPLFVNVKLVWSCTDIRNKLEIIAAASGPSDIQRLALFECDGSQTPRVLDANITAEFQWWIVAQGGYRQIGYRVMGNPANDYLWSPRIQELTLDIIWP